MSRANFLYLPQWNLLNDWCHLIRIDYPDVHGPFLVGSAISKRDYRDVDIRMIVPNRLFDRWFVGAKHYPYPRGKLAHMNTAYSLYAQQATGLPVDFQFQRMTDANKEYATANGHPRHAMGMKL